MLLWKGREFQKCTGVLNLKVKIDTTTYHVGLEEGALKVDVMVIERLVDGSQDSLGHLLGAVKVVLT